MTQTIFRGTGKGGDNITGGSILHLLFIDPRHLSDTDKMLIISALSKLSLVRNAFTSRIVKDKESIYSILKQNNNIEIKARYNKSNSVQDVIQEVNSLSQSYDLLAGASISVPLLPVLPHKNNTEEVSQYVDIYTNSVIAVSTDILMYEGLVKSIPTMTFADVGLWAYPLSEGDFNAFKSFLSEDTFNKLYGEALVDVQPPVFSKVEFPAEQDAQFPGAEEVNIEQSVLSIVQAIDQKYFSTYYVLDFFNGQKCEHGMKVLDVIRIRLAQLGLSHLDTHIVAVPINYFSNREFANQFLEKYFTVDLNKYPNLKLWQKERKAVFKSLKSIKQSDIKDCGNCIPEVYLNACLNFYYGLKPDIISTSFYMTTYGGSLISKFTTQSPTNIVAAALNESQRNIEDLFAEYPNPEILPVGSIQPISQLYTQYMECGGIIVGSRLGSGKYSGMISSQGDRVSVLGKGAGWGHSGSCITSSEKGTSFATPDVGLTLYLAKAFWRSKQLKVSAVEARRRLLLSVDLEPEFVGKFAAGGVTNLKKLLTLTGALGVDSNGATSEINVRNNSFIRYNQNKVVTFNADMDGCSGLSIIKSKTYLFFNSSMSWREVDINNLQLSVQVKNALLVFNHINEVSKVFKEILYY